MAKTKTPEMVAAEPEVAAEPVPVESVPPTLQELLSECPWDGNEKCVPSRLLAGVTEAELESAGYVRIRSGIGGTILIRF